MNNKDYNIFEKVIYKNNIKPNFNEIKEQTIEIINHEKRLQIKTIELLRIILKYCFTISMLMLFMLIVSIIGFDSNVLNQSLFIKVLLLVFIIFANLSLVLKFVIILKERKIK